MTRTLTNAARRHRPLLGAFALAAVAAAAIGLLAPNAAPAQSSGGADSPEVLVVKFHADWCAKCKAMGPTYIDLVNKYDESDALFLTFDFTTAFDRTQSEYHAAALGLHDVWRQHGGKTGFVLVIDAESRRVLEKLGHTADLSQMGSALEQSIRAAR